MPCTTVTRLGMHGPRAGQRGGRGARPAPFPMPARLWGQRGLTAMPDPAATACPAGPAAPSVLCSPHPQLSTAGPLCHHSPPVLPSPRQHTSSSVGPDPAAAATGRHEPWDSHASPGDTGQGQH